MSTGENWKLLQANLEGAGEVSKTYIARHWMPYGPGKMPVWGVTGEECVAQSLIVTTQVPGSFSLAPEIPVTPEMMKINTGHKPYTGPFPVTEEMLFVGSNACLKSHSSPNEMAKAVYRAMAALVPVERSADHDRQIVHDSQLVPLAYHEEKIGCMRDNLELALDRERRARDEIALLRSGWDGATEGWNEAREQLTTLISHADAQKELLAVFREQIATRDAHIAELDSQLAAFTAANVSDTPSEPAHNPFQAFTGDPRRMGR